MRGYWAAEGRISTTPIKGGVVISREQYKAALAVMSDPEDKRVIAIEGGEMVLTLPPEPEVEPEPELTPEEQRAALGWAVQAHLDTAARERQYDGMFALSTYVADPNPVFAAEAAAGIAWRSAVWAKVGEIEADVIAGRRDPPRAEQLIAELPPMVWPA